MTTNDKLLDKGVTWDLSLLYDGLDDPQINADVVDFEQKAQEFADEWNSRTSEFTTPAVLHQALDDWERLQCFNGVAKACYYLTLYREINLNDNVARGLEETLLLKKAKIEEKTNFFEFAVGKIDASYHELLLDDPQLAKYRVWLKRRFEEAAHDLSPEAKTVIDRFWPMAVDSWEKLVQDRLAKATATVTIDGVATPVPFQQLAQLAAHTDPKVVVAATDAAGKIARDNADVAAAELCATVQSFIAKNELRGFGNDHIAASCLDNGLSTDVVNSMLETIARHTHVSHRFYALRAQLQGKPSIDYALRSMPYGALPANIPFSRAVEMMRTMLVNISPAFVAKFDDALVSGMIDSVPRSGKRGGAACWLESIVLPSYMMSNYSGTLNDVQTLAHEFGHYLNMEYMRTGNCDALTYSVPTAFAEVLSTFFEKYILDEVLKTADDATRLAVLIRQIDGIVSSVFRQSAATRFELDLYEAVAESGYQTPDQINLLFASAMNWYLGPAVMINNSAQTGWVSWWHFRANLYNYGYSFARMITMAMQVRYDADPAYLERVMVLMRAGKSMTTEQVFTALDLSIDGGQLWLSGIDSLNRQIAEAEALATKLGVI